MDLGEDIRERGLLLIGKQEWKKESGSGEGKTCYF